MDEVWIPLLSTLIGAVAALAGGAISPWVGGRTAQQQWRRDKLAEVCEAFVSVLNEATKSLEAYDGSTPPPSHRRKCEDIFKRLLEASSKMTLYCSPNLEWVASDIWADYQVAYLVMFEPSVKDDEELSPRAMRLHIGSLAAQALATIRHDLGVRDRKQLAFPTLEYDRSPKRPGRWWRR